MNKLLLQLFETCIREPLGHRKNGTKDKHYQIYQINNNYLKYLIPLGHEFLLTRVVYDFLDQPIHLIVSHRLLFEGRL